MCSILHLMVTLITLAIIGIAAYFIAKYAINKAGLDDEVEDLNNSLRDKLNELLKQGDPYTGQNNTQAWPNKGKGLELTVVNALSEDWYPYFTTAIEEWDSGTPDALTLTTEVGQVDSNCSAIEGVLKVCNGNYGETDWKGINKVLMDTVTNYIVASTALMNEFYLPSSASDDEKQYTMCHEIGHGFGLPHTDENFYNKDLGNCLDYTMNPGTNKQPATVNYELLAKVYGTVNGQSTNTGGNDNTNGSSSQELQVDTGNNNRQRRRLGEQSDNNNNNNNNNFDVSYEQQQVPVPTWVVDAMNEIDTLFVSSKISLSDDDHSSTIYRNRRLVEKTKFGEIHHIDLDDSYTVRVRVLFA